MSEERPVPPDPVANEASALREAAAAPLRPGDPRRVGPYLPLALLGSGGMGRVYLARPEDDSPGLFAVKVIRPEYAEDTRFRRRFEHEVSVHGQVRTPHTPRLCGTGFQHELLWMATEYLPALDLAEVVREDGSLGAATVWRLVAELGEALADLAATGIVHRDLKPSNVLLSVRGAHVIDFGIAKAADASAITGTGNRVGTPAYMSPEYLRTGRCDTASDVFSLAGTLVYAAAGRAPFGDGTGVDVMHRVAFEEPNPEVIGEISEADPALGSLLSACLAKEPEQRPTPRDLIDAAGAQARTPGWPEPLHGKVLARQRAYEALHLLPVERMAHLRSADDPPKAVLPAPSERAAQSAPPQSGPPVEATGPSAEAEAPPKPSRPAGALARVRRKPVPAVAAGITLCAAAAALFVLTRHDAPSAASPPGAVAPTTAGTGDDTFPPTPGSSDGTSAPGTSGNGANVAGGDASPSEVSGSAGDGRRDDPAVPGTETSVGAGADAGAGAGADAGTDIDTGTVTDPTPSSTSTSASPESATAPWNSDCTHYSGNGRTRQGNQGKRVQQLQCMLTKRGYGVGSTDGDGNFGPGTEAAVRSFQSDKGLDADGVVGRETWVALRGTE
ncbi:protein kinase domain-containing protein [Streptomyces sp. NPDC002845]